MPTNQTSNQNAKLRGKQPGAQTERRRQPAEEASTNYGLGDMAEQASEYVSEGADRVGECVREHTGAAIVATLVTGFGIGLIVGHSLGSSRRQTRSFKDRVMAEGLGRRILDRIEGMIPDALAERFGK